MLPPTPHLTLPLSAWRLVLALLIIAGLLGVAAPKAAAATVYWRTSNGSLSEPPNGTRLSSFSCNGGICVASGLTEFYRNVPWATIGLNLTSDNGTFAEVDSSNITGPAAPVFATSASYCDGQSFCLTAGNGVDDFSSTVTATSPTWTANYMYPTSYTGGEGVVALSCVSATLCVAADEAGNILTSATPGSSAPWGLTTIDTASGANQELAYLSCSSDGLCAAADKAGDVYVNSDIANSDTWTETAVDPDLTTGQTVTGISCPSLNLCVLSDSGGRLFISTAPNFTFSWQTDIISTYAINGVSCASAQLCVAVDGNGSAYTSFTPGNPTTWTADAIDASYPLTAVACSPSDNTCIATDSASIFIGTTSLLGQPDVETTPSSVADTTATMNGTVDPNNDPVSSCSFTYNNNQQSLAENSNSNITIPCSPALIGGGNTPVTISANLTKLVPGTTYYYTISAANSYGSVTTPVASFTTSGASAPTLDGTGVIYNFGQNSADIGLNINPHNTANVDYTVFYSSTSHPNGLLGGDQLYSDYAYQPLGQTALTFSGTSDQEVDITLPGVGPDQTYYYRVLLSWANGSSQSDESAFSTWYPTPTNSSPPYLQSNGYDANQGYQLLCQPGNWNNISYQTVNLPGGQPIYLGYNVRWVYVDQYNDVLGPAPGSTSNMTYPNDEYNVTSQDEGQQVACEVQGITTAGGKAQTSSWVLSNSTIPENETELKVPSWVKQALTAGSGLGDLQSLLSADGPILACLDDAEIAAATVVFAPETAAGLCLFSVAMFLSSHEATNIISDQIDPPAPHYQQLALLPSATRPPPSSCPKRWGRVRCQTFTRDFTAFERAQAQVVNATELMSTTGNAYLIARKKGNSPVEFLQLAALRVDFGFYGQALKVEHTAAVQLFAYLGRQHVRIVARASKQTVEQFVRSALGRQLQHLGISRAQMTRLLTPIWHLRGHHAISVTSYEHTPNPIMFTRAYQQLNFTDLEAFILGFKQQHTLSASVATTLEQQMNTAAAACTLSARVGDLKQLLATAKIHTNTRTDAFLTEALAPLMNSAAGAPLRSCPP